MRSIDVADHLVGAWSSSLAENTLTGFMISLARRNAPTSPFSRLSSSAASDVTQIVRRSRPRPCAATATAFPGSSQAGQRHGGSRSTGSRDTGRTQRASVTLPHARPAVRRHRFHPDSSAGTRCGPIQEEQHSNEEGGKHRKWARTCRDHVHGVESMPGNETGNPRTARSLRCHRADAGTKSLAAATHEPPSCGKSVRRTPRLVLLGKKQNIKMNAFSHVRETNASGHTGCTSDRRADHHPENEDPSKHECVAGSFALSTPGLK